ncbi:MAG TPA: metallophosphoesterase [Rhizomicrobium sp.]|jgi:predicted MPP superfamily phosphohydrolase|nr:metallophosphoesterase [Rhizomicrobium sp.]
MRVWGILWPGTRRGAIWRLVLVVILALGADAFWLEPASIRAVRHEIVLDRADAGDIGTIRIAVIGDLHAGSAYIDADKIRRVVALANDAKPDLILLAGDYVHAPISAAPCRSRTARPCSRACMRRSASMP